MKRKITTILIIITLVALGGTAIFTAIKLYKSRQEAVAPNVPQENKAAPSGTVLENPNLKVTVIDTGPGNYESNTYFKPGGQTDSRPITDNVLTQKYTLENKTNNTYTIKLLAFPYKMYTIGSTNQKNCVDLFTKNQINNYVKEIGEGDPEKAYQKFAESFYNNIPAWQGPKEIQSLNLPEAVTIIQAGTGFILGGKAVQSIWINNNNYKRYAPIENGEIKWSQATNWENLNTSAYPGSGEIQAEAIYVADNTIYEEIIRSNKLYRRKITVSDSSASPFILWQQGNWESWQEVNISQYPGSGNFQTLTAYIIGDQLAQGFWRGNKGYSRRIPVENGLPQWNSEASWNGPIEISSLPGSGDMEAQIDSFVTNNRFYNSLWRGGQGFERQLYVVENVIRWNAEHCYDNPAIPPHDPSQGQTRLNLNGGSGSLTCKFYQEKNIKTCTDSQTLISYGQNPAYLVSAEEVTLGPHEKKENIAFSIQNDTCGFYQWDHGLLINNSEVFWTGSEIKFFTCPTPNLTNNCSLSLNLVSITPTLTPTPTPTLTPTATATPTEAPNGCGGTCGSNTNCQEDLFCYQGYCRNSDCPSETDCSCPGQTTAPTLTPTPTSTTRTVSVTKTLTPTPTEASLPQAGNTTPTLIGLGSGFLLLLFSLLLAI